MPTRIQETLWKERLLATTPAGLGLLTLFVAGAGVAGCHSTLCDAALA